MMRLIFLFCFGMSIFSCEKDDNISSLNQDPSRDPEPREPVPVMDSSSSITQFLRNANGVRIHQFIEDGINKTNYFRQYLFTFRASGIVTATKAGESISGTYLVFRDDNKTELRMKFSGSNSLFELSDDWYFVSLNDGIIRFQDSGDIVQFQKQ